MPNNVNTDSDLSPTEYMDFEQMWEKKRKSEGSKDLPKFGASDFKFITVLGKGSFGKVGVHALVCVIICIQEALLTQTSRATFCISRNLVNRCITIETSCTKEPRKVRVGLVELEH